MCIWWDQAHSVWYDHRQKKSVSELWNYDFCYTLSFPQWNKMLINMDAYWYWTFIMRFMLQIHLFLLDPIITNQGDIFIFNIRKMRSRVQELLRVHDRAIIYSTSLWGKKAALHNHYTAYSKFVMTQKAIFKMRIDCKQYIISRVSRLFLTYRILKNN